MKIKVSGDIVIGGFIEGGWIEAGAASRYATASLAAATSRESTFANSMRRGDPRQLRPVCPAGSGGDIQIQSQLSHCYSRSGQDIKVGDSNMRKGTLLGGTSIANRLIMAPSLGAEAANHTRLQILGGYFTHKEQEHQLKLRQQACQAQLEKIKELVMKLLQLPGDKRNPDTLRKLKPIRDHQLAELAQLDEQLTANQEELRNLMAQMEVIATQHLYSGIEVEMASFKRKVTITRGPTRLTIHDETLEMTPYEGHK